jgi:branched-chain amino acid transport system ATP-binding protein
MDEPTEGLAPVVVETLTAALVKIRGESGLTIILVEQNSRVAFEFSDRSVVLDKGRIVYDGASNVLRDDPERLAKVIGVSE